MSTRRSRPPRNRKARNTDRPRPDVAATAPEDPVKELAQEGSPSTAAAPDDDLEALDAGWD
jgi:hypothetical protein